MNNTLAKSLTYSTIVEIFKKERPEFEYYGTEIKILPTKTPDTVHVIVPNGDEYDYTIENVKTKLVKVEKRYRFVDQTFSEKEIIRKYCSRFSKCSNGCCFKNSNCPNRQGEAGIKDQIEKLIKAGIIEEVK